MAVKSIAHSFFVDDIGDLCCLSKEIEVFSNRTLHTGTFCPTTKGIVIQIIASLFQLIGQAIVGVVEIETEKVSYFTRYWAARSMCSHFILVVVLEGL